MTKVSTNLADKETLSHRIAYRTVRNLVTWFCRCWCRMRVEGREHIPTSGVFIMAPTHRSILDTPITSGVTRRRMRFMGADKWWSNRQFGTLLTMLGGFPVSRGSADREALRRCIELLDGGEPLVLFPEGERKSGPLVQPLFEGAAYIATKTGAPIVPVGIGGSEKAMPKGAKFIYPKRVHVVVGPPIPVPAFDSPKAGREAARQITETLHTELQRLFDLAQTRAGH
jgi:1-acyl-sn-glycerol-3-phosphate acyltransferase